MRAAGFTSSPTWGPNALLPTDVPSVHKKATVHPSWIPSMELDVLTWSPKMIPKVKLDVLTWPPKMTNFKTPKPTGENVRHREQKAVKKFTASFDKIEEPATSKPVNLHDWEQSAAKKLRAKIHPNASNPTIGKHQLAKKVRATTTVNTPEISKPVDVHSKKVRATTTVDTPEISKPVDVHFYSKKFYGKHWFDTHKMSQTEVRRSLHHANEELLRHALFKHKILRQRVVHKLHLLRKTLHKAKNSQTATAGGLWRFHHLAHLVGKDSRDGMQLVGRALKTPSPETFHCQHWCKWHQRIEDSKEAALALRCDCELHKK